MLREGGGGSQPRPQDQPPLREQQCIKTLSSPAANGPPNVWELNAATVRTFPGNTGGSLNTRACLALGGRQPYKTPFLRDPPVEVRSPHCERHPKKVAPQVRRQTNKVTMEIWSGLPRSMKLSMLCYPCCTGADRGGPALGLGR